MPIFNRSARRGKSARTPLSGGIGLLQRVTNGLRAFVKGFGITWDGDVGWHSFGMRGYSTRFPGSDLDWEAEAGKLTLNSVVAICAQYYFDKIVEPRVHVVYEDASGDLQPVPKHPAVSVLLRPNAEYSGNDLLSALALSFKTAGNAFAVKVRGGRGKGVPLELWYIPHWRIFPIPPDDGGPTEFYLYKQPTKDGSTINRVFPAADVLHIRNGCDPDNPRMGFNSFRAQLRSVVSDNEIDACTAIILRNKGVIGTIISPSDNETEITPDQAEELKRKVEGSATGDSRAGIIALSLPVKVDQLNSSAEDLALTTIGDRPAARICAAFGIDPTVVNLAASSSKGEKYGSMRKESRASSYEQAILPMLAKFAETFTYHLLPDFGTDIQEFWIEFDYSRVRDLQEDADAVSKRSVTEFQGNIATLDEARAKAGYKPAEDEALGEKFYFQLVGPPGGTLGVPGADANATAGGESLPPEPDEDQSDD